MRLKEEHERASLKLNIEISGNHGIWPHYFLASRGGKGEDSDRFPLLGLKKSLWEVTAAMKSEDDCFLAGKR